MAGVNLKGLTLEDLEDQIMGMDLTPEEERELYNNWFNENPQSDPLQPRVMTPEQESEIKNKQFYGLPFKDFEMQLAEMNLSPEEERWHYNQWTDMNTAGGKLKKAMTPEELPEGRERADMLPMGKPEGMTGWEAIRSGEAELAAPQGAIDFMQSLGRSAGTVENLSRGREVPKENVNEAAWMTAGLGAVGGAPFRVPEGSTRIFGGPSAKNIDWGKGLDAADMKRAGYPHWMIWEDTGFEFDKENNAWRFEIDSSKAKYTKPVNRIKNDLREAYYKLLANEPDPKQRKLTTSAENLIDFPEFFENYPEARTISVVFDYSMKPESRGYMNFKTNALGINPKWFEKDPEGAMDTIVHELQHYVQNKEGFVSGMSSDFLKGLPQISGVAKELQAQLIEANKKLDEIYTKSDVDGGRSLKPGVTFQEANSTLDELMAAQKKVVNFEKELFKLYEGNIGEIEARATTLRRNMTEEERRTTTMSETMTEAFNRVLADKYKGKINFNSFGLDDETENMLRGAN